jgi:hypothetical protein
MYKNTSTGESPNSGTQEIQVTSSLLPGTENGITDAMKAEAFANRLYFYDACSADGTLGFGSIGQFTTLKSMMINSDTLLGNQTINDFAYGDSTREGTQTLLLTALEKYEAMVERYQSTNPPLGLNPSSMIDPTLKKYSFEFAFLLVLFGINSFIIFKKLTMNH